MIKDIFKPETTQVLVSRIHQLNQYSPALWGTMNVAQMLAHCNVSYELVFDDTHPKPGVFKKMLVTWFVKKAVVSEKPYKKNGPTSPEFKITEPKDFEIEKARLIDFITKTQQLGESYFEGKESYTFGVLSSSEWNNMFYKHLEHHLNQFGV